MNEASGAPDPTFSVIVPTCNRPNLLGRCLAQLAAGRQTVDAGRYEVIVTDDSPDETTRDRVLAEFPWARWVAGPRRGPAANRNSGAAHSRGVALLFTDDDCIPDPGWIEGFEPALAMGWQLSPGRTISRETWTSPLDFAPRNESGNVVWSCNVFVRRDAFAVLGGFDERFPSAHMEDADFHARAVQAGIVTKFSAGAVIDHPPRRLPGGRTLGELHYAEVLYGVLHNAPVGLVQTFRRIAAARIAALRTYTVNADTVRACISLIVELAWVALRWPAWQARAARAARAVRT